MNIVHVPGAVYTEAESGILVPKADADADAALLGQIAEAEVRRESLRGSITHIMGKITAMFSHLNDYNRSVQQDIARIRAEIAELQAELRKAVQEEANKHREPDDLDSEFESFNNTYDESNFEFSGLDEQEGKPEDQNIVKLFRMIANKTHPDKTDDPELHMLFVTAKEYRQNGDYEGLKRIWDYITGQAESAERKREEELRKRLEEILQEMSMLEQQLEYMRHSDDYQLLNAYELDQSSVLRMSWVQMNNRYRSLLDQARMLRQLAGKPAPRVYDFLTFGS